MGTRKLSGKPVEMLGGNLRWTSTPYGRISNTSSPSHATETGISSVGVGHWVLINLTFKSTSEIFLLTFLDLIFL